MTRLRKMMLEELQRRNYAETTIDCYISTLEDFARHFHCPPDRLGPRQIREYQAELFQKRKLSANTVAQRVAALRFVLHPNTQKSLEHRRNLSLPKTPNEPNRISVTCYIGLAGAVMGQTRFSVGTGYLPSVGLQLTGITGVILFKFIRVVPTTSWFE